MKFATTWNECEAIIQKHGYDMIAGTTMYSENLISINRNKAVRKSGETILHQICLLGMSKHIIYDFHYNIIKTTFHNVELLGQDTGSLIV